MIRKSKPKKKNVELLYKFLKQMAQKNNSKGSKK